MDFFSLLIQLLNSVQYGLLLFLIASGLTLIFGIMGVVEQGIRRLIPLKVEDTGMLSRFDRVDPVIPRRDNFAVDGGGRVEGGFGDHEGESFRF